METPGPWPPGVSIVIRGITIPTVAGTAHLTITSGTMHVSTSGTMHVSTGPGEVAVLVVVSPTCILILKCTGLIVILGFTTGMAGTFRALRV
jgi:hypothetical protein